MKHVQQPQQEIKDIHMGLLRFLCLLLHLFFRCMNVNRFGLRTLAAQHAQLVLRQIADSFTVFRNFKLLSELFVFLLKI